MLNFSEVSLNDVAEYTKIPMYERYNFFSINMGQTV